MAKVLCARRTALGMTQARLAVHPGVDRRQVRRYEAGQCQPALAVAVRLTPALGITLDQLAASQRADLSGQWWVCRRGDRLAADPQPVVARAGPAGAYTVWTADGADPGGHRLRGELRLLDEALVGWYASRETTAATGALFLLLKPNGRRAVGRWVGRGGDGQVSEGLAALARTQDGATAAVDPFRGGVAR